MKDKEERMEKLLRENMKAIFRGHCNLAICDEDKFNAVADSLDIEVLIVMLEGYCNDG